MNINRLPIILVLGIPVIQLCVAALLGLYALGIGTAEAHIQGNLTQHKQEIQKAPEQSKLTLTAVTIADEAYNSALWAEHFSTTIFIAVLLLFGFGCVELWAAGQLIRQGTHNV